MSNMDYEKDYDIKNLTGKILLSISEVSDKYLNKTMVFICSHDSDGAMGIIINKLIPNINIHNILEKLNINTEGIESTGVLFGGLEEIDKCFVLHSSDYMASNSTIINKRIALTINGDILKVISSPSGPEKKIVCMGCCLWDMEQLENEVASSYWIPIDSDEALIFGDPTSDKWGKALLKIGSHTSMFSNVHGNA